MISVNMVIHKTIATHITNIFITKDRYRGFKFSFIGKVDQLDLGSCLHCLITDGFKSLCK